MTDNNALFIRGGRSCEVSFADRVLSSPLYLILLVICCAVPYIFSAYAAGFWLCVFLLSLSLVLTRNIMPSFAAFLFCTVAVIEQYKITYEEIFGYAGVLALVIPALIYHIIRYRRGRRGYRPGRMFAPQLAVSAALLLGGLGSISAKEYFSLPSIYYMLFLGVVLLGIMVFLDCDMPADGEYAAKYLANTLIAVAALFCVMWLIAFFKDGAQEFPYRQWKNNAGNFMLLAVPLTLWRGARSQRGVFYLLFAVLQCFVVFISGSRGATLMIGVTGLVSVAVYFVFVKNTARRAAEFAVLFALAVVVAAVVLSDGAARLKEFIGEMDVFDGNGREELYYLGIRNILDYPLFGVGIGYRNDEVWKLNDMAIFWYHSTPVQIFASMGAVGGAAYLWQFIERLKLALRRNHFSVAALLSFIGFEGYSCVNTGDFTPLPFGVLLAVMFIVLERYNRDLPFIGKSTGERVDFMRGRY